MVPVQKFTKSFVINHSNHFDRNREILNNGDNPESDAILTGNDKQWYRFNEKTKSECLFNIIAISTTILILLVFIISLGTIIYKLQTDVKMLKQEIRDLKSILNLENIYSDNESEMSDYLEDSLKTKEYNYEYTNDEEPEYFDRDDNANDTSLSPNVDEIELRENIPNGVPLTEQKVRVDKIHEANDLKVEPSIRQQTIFGSLAVHEILGSRIHSRKRREYVGKSRQQKNYSSMKMTDKDCTNANQFIGAHYKAADSPNKLESCSRFTWESKIRSKCLQTRLSDGQMIEIKRSGVYFIYAQLFYNHSRLGSGFAVKQTNANRVSINILKCVITTHTVNKGHALTNSCYVAGLALLQGGDTIHIQSNHPHEMCISDEDKSYLGLFKVAELENVDDDKISLT